MNRINESLSKVRRLFAEIKEGGEMTGLKELDLIRNNRNFLEVGSFFALFLGFLFVC